jgi:3-methyladenine DNA glycosylase Mpg
MKENELNGNIYRNLFKSLLFLSRKSRGMPENVLIRAVPSVSCGATNLTTELNRRNDLENISRGKRLFDVSE